MSALRMLAWGMVSLSDMTPDQRNRLRRDARDEAQSHGYWISGCKQLGCCTWTTPEGGWTHPLHATEHKLTRWNKRTFRNPRRPGINDRNKPITTGSFAECCKSLVALIEPSDPNPAE
jgi:hypothetical protein